MRRFVTSSGITVIVALLATPGVVGAQSPPSVSEMNPLLWAPVDVEPAQAQEDAGESRPASTVATTAFLAAGGSIAGFYAGAAAGCAGAGGECFGAALLSGLVGSWVGAGLGASLTTRRPARAFGGSAAGLLGGLAAAFLLEQTSMGWEVGLIGYALTHGVITASVAERQGR